MRFACIHCHTMLLIDDGDIVTTCPHCNKQWNVHELIVKTIDFQGIKAEIRTKGQKFIYDYIMKNFGDVKVVCEAWLTVFVKAVGQLEREEPIKTQTFFNKLEDDLK